MQLPILDPKSIPLSNKPNKSLSSFLKNESGQATVEYILILGMAILAASGIGRGLMAVMDRGVVGLGGKLEQQLKTGRAPADVWTN